MSRWLHLCSILLLSYSIPSGALGSHAYLLQFILYNDNIIAQHIASYSQWLILISSCFCLYIYIYIYTYICRYGYEDAKPLWQAEGDAGM